MHNFSPICLILLLFYLKKLKILQIKLKVFIYQYRLNRFGFSYKSLMGILPVCWMLKTIQWRGSMSKCISSSGLALSQCEGVVLKKSGCGRWVYVRGTHHMLPSSSDPLFSRNLFWTKSNIHWILFYIINIGEF